MVKVYTAGYGARGKTPHHNTRAFSDMGGVLAYLEKVHKGYCDERSQSMDFRTWVLHAYHAPTVRIFPVDEDKPNTAYRGEALLALLQEYKEQQL